MSRLYQLHNMVSDKLDRQNWENKGSPGQYVAPRALTEVCLRRMLVTTLREVSEEDVWNHLEIFAYGSGLPECSGGQQAFANYCARLAEFLKPDLAEEVQQISQRASSYAPDQWDCRNATMVVNTARRMFGSKTVSMPEFEKDFRCVEAVQAGKCEKGTCV